MDFKKIENILKKEPPYRLKQVKKAIFSDLINNWQETTILPKDLRQTLSQKYSIGSDVAIEKISFSKNGETLKVLFCLKDDNRIESVLMKHKDGRRTVCVSSQVGCAMSCKFCATGQQGFKRNLSTGEIIEQVLFFSRLLKRKSSAKAPKEQEKITNVVFMGMGEPLLNYDNVLSSISTLNDKEGFNLGSRHISVSTVGIPEGIKKLFQENLQINLAVSLHAPNNELRSELIPVNKVYPLETVLNAVNDYILTTNRRVMIEYLLINDINDSPQEAKELSLLLKRFLKKNLFFVNIITYNPLGHSVFSPPAGEKVKKFKEVLRKNNTPVTQRYRFGKSIKAACGQLTGNK